MRSHFSLLTPAVLLAAPALDAQVISRDSFSAYTVGAPLPGQDPLVSGYVGPWVGVAFGTARPSAMTGSLEYGDPAYAAGIGHHVGKVADGAGIQAGNSGRTERLLDTNLSVDDTTVGTLYLSWLFRTGNENAAAQPDLYQTLALWNGSGDIDSLRDFEAGIASGDFATANYGFRVDNNTPTDLGVTRDADVHLFVVKFELSDAALSDSVTVWIDPDLGAGDPAGGMVVSSRDIAFDRLVLSDYASDSSAWDEIRWGSTFDSVTTTEIEVPDAPVFELQPMDYFGSVGDTFQLTSFAPADPEATYLWEFSADGSDPWTPQGTSAALDFVDATFGQNGFYRVTATNVNGAVTSDEALVDLIYPEPTILQQPLSVFGEEGTAAAIVVVAEGVGNLTYQWFKNLEAMPGEESDTLNLPSLSAADEAEYYVEITDDAAEASSQPATFIESDVVTVSIFEPWDGLVSHDPFDTSAAYVTGALAGQSPEISGYLDAWALTDGFGPISPLVSSGSLIYSDPLYLGSSGDRIETPADTEGINATNAGRVGRLLEPRLVVADSSTGTRYLSWLFRSGFENAAPDPQIYQTLALFNGPLGVDGNRDFEAGIANGDFGTTNFAYRLNNNTGLVGNTGVPSDGNVHLFVAKFELSDQPGSDSVTVWIDPDLGSGEPAGGVTVGGADLLWDRIAFSDYASDSSHWDEIRWGSSFESVTLHPNPADDFATWIALYPGVGSLNGFDDDADGDGIKNGLENVFGTDPSVPTKGITQVAATGSTITFRHPQSGPSASDVSAAYRWSTDLTAFHDSGAASGGTTVTIAPAPNTPSAGTTSVTATVSGTQPSRLFLVLEANQTP